MQDAKCKMQNEANPAAPAICRPDGPSAGAVIGRLPAETGQSVAPAICRPDVPSVGAVIGRPPEAVGIEMQNTKCEMRNAK